VTESCITKPAFDDLMCSIDGLILYIWIIQQRYPNAPIVPWFMTSDPCELFFAFCRIGCYRGRHTNLDALDICRGMEKKNRSVVLDGEGVHLLEHDIAHTRGRAILRPENQTHSDQVLFCGKDTSQNDIKSAVLTGMEIGKELFARYTCFRDLEDVDDDESGDFGNWTEETSEEVTDDESDNEDFGIDLEE
jgi:hypothetical protein